MSDIELHSTHSTLRERIVEHLFVGEALRCLWQKGVTDFEVLRSEFDAHGYDLVMQRGDVVRHIQFKTGVRDKPSPASIGQALAEKPSGCVIWISVSLDLQLEHFWWFGDEPGKPLPDMTQFDHPKRIGRNAEGDRPARTNHKKVPARFFTRLDSVEEVLSALFGDIRPD